MLPCVMEPGAAMFLVLVRLPALASLRLELLQGTLRGVAVSFLSTGSALLISLRSMVRRGERPAAIRVRAGSAAAGG